MAAEANSLSLWRKLRCWHRGTCHLSKFLRHVASGCPSLTAWHADTTFPGQKPDTRHEWLPSIDLPAQFWTLGWYSCFETNFPAWCVYWSFIVANTRFKAGHFKAITASEPALRQMLANRGVTCPKASRSSRKSRMVWQHWYSKIMSNTVALSICQLGFMDTF